MSQPFVDLPVPDKRPDAPAPGFAVTKIQPPQSRANLVARESLERDLGAALAARRLTLLCAPAGFGKTAALTRQVGQLPPDTALAWIGADVDDDLHRFLRCLFAALEPYDLPWRVAPDALVAAAVNSRDARREVAAAVLNALAAGEHPRGLVVIDDAHRITDAAVFEFLDFLLDRLPRHWGVVVSSRVDPPLSLARLRAGDELAEFRQAELRFARDEVVALVAASGSEADAARLLERTGGWAAGLRLVINAARHGRAGAADPRRVDRHVFDYLATEVLDELPAELSEFLVACSVLPELEATRCAAVTGNPRAAELLDEIERLGLFVSVIDAETPTLTLHDLFRDCLAERLARTRPDCRQALLRRAADTEPDAIRRLSFLLRAGAWDDAESVLVGVAETLLAEGAIEPVLRLVDQFPSERIERSPLLAFIRGQCAWAQWDWRAMAVSMARARRGFEAAGDVRHAHRARVFELIALCGDGDIDESSSGLAELDLDESDLETRALARALTAWNAISVGDFHVIAPRYNEALDILERVEGLHVWYQCFQRPLYVWFPGMREPIERFVAGVRRRAGEAPNQMQAIAWVMEAWLALWQGDLVTARARVAQAQDASRWLGEPNRIRMFVNCLLASLHAVAGERDAMLDALDRLLGYFDSAPVSGAGSTPTSMLAHYLLYAARLADTVGDGESLRAFAARMPPPARIKNLELLAAPLETLEARLAAADRRWPDACDTWQRALDNEAAIDVAGLAQEARLRLAHALLALGRRAEAAAALAPLLDGAPLDDGIGGVLLAGGTVLDGLAAAPWGTLLPASGTSRLKRWARLGARCRLAAGASPGLPSAGPLSARELQVLERIAAGDSNKLIARALDLSPHTVKRHVANILDRLGVASRREAAAWHAEHVAVAERERQIS